MTINTLEERILDNEVYHYKYDDTLVVDASYFDIDDPNPITAATNLQKAILAAKGGVLSVPAGTYTINIERSTIDLSDVILQGQGPSTIFQAYPPLATDNHVMFAVAAGCSSSIRDVEIRGPESSVDYSTRAVIHYGTSGTLQISRCTITAWTNPIKSDEGATKIIINNSTIVSVDSSIYMSSGVLHVGNDGYKGASVTARNCQFTGAITDGHQFYIFPDTDLIVENCYLAPAIGRTGYGAGIHLYGPTPTSGRTDSIARIIDCTFPAGVGAAVITGPYATTLIQNCTIESYGVALRGPTTIIGCSFTNSNIYSSSVEVDISNSIITNCTFTGISCLLINLGAPSNIQIRNCTFAISRIGLAYPLQLQTGTDFTIKGCTFNCDASLRYDFWVDVPVTCTFKQCIFASTYGDLHQAGYISATTPLGVCFDSNNPLRPSLDLSPGAVEAGSVWYNDPPT